MTMHRWAAERREQWGKVQRTPDVIFGKYRFAGTRIDVSGIAALLRGGEPDDWILRNYPSLTPADLERARTWRRW